jgi:hypothetical protein
MGLVDEGVDMSYWVGWCVVVVSRINRTQDFQLNDASRPDTEF